MPETRTARIAAAVGIIACFAPPLIYLLADFLTTTAASRRAIVLLGVIGAVGTASLWWGLGGWRRSTRRA